MYIVSIHSYSYLVIFAFVIPCSFLLHEVAGYGIFNLNVFLDLFYSLFIFPYSVFLFIIMIILFTTAKLENIDYPQSKVNLILTYRQSYIFTWIAVIVIIVFDIAVFSPNFDFMSCLSSFSCFPFIKVGAIFIFFAFLTAVLPYFVSNTNIISIAGFFMLENYEQLRKIYGQYEARKLLLISSWIIKKFIEKAIGAGTLKSVELRLSNLFSCIIFAMELQDNCFSNEIQKSQLIGWITALKKILLGRDIDNARKNRILCHLIMFNYTFKELSDKVNSIGLVYKDILTELGLGIGKYLLPSIASSIFITWLHLPI